MKNKKYIMYLYPFIFALCVWAFLVFVQALSGYLVHPPLVAMLMVAGGVVGVFAIIEEITQ